MPSFRPRDQWDIDGLDDEEQLAHLAAARAAGDDEQVLLTLRIMSWGHWDYIASLVRKADMPDDCDTEALVGDVLAAAVKSAASAPFDGHARGQFRKWLKVITHNTTVNWWRKRNPGGPDAPLPAEHEGEDDRPWGRDPYVVDETAAVETQAIVDEVYGELNPTHQRVVDLHISDDLPARETAEQIGEGMTADNVAAIVSRFRKELRRRLDAAGGEPRWENLT